MGEAADRCLLEASSRGGGASTGIGGLLCRLVEKIGNKLSDIKVSL